MPTQRKFLDQSFFALNNVLDTPELLAALEAHGYGAKALQVGLGLHAQIEVATETRDAAYGLVRSTNRAAQQAKGTLLELFRGHLTLARTAFEREGYPDDMKITGPRAGATGEWLAQAKKFYQHVPIALMVKYHVPQKELVEAQKMVAKVMELLALQKKTNSQAQQLTQDRRARYHEFYNWMKKFMGIARAIFDAQPQRLEALSQLVKS